MYKFIEAIDQAELITTFDIAKEGFFYGISYATKDFWGTTWYDSEIIAKRLKQMCCYSHHKGKVKGILYITELLWYSIIPKILRVIL